MKNLDTLHNNQWQTSKTPMSLVKNKREAMLGFLSKFPEGIILTPGLRKQISMAIQETSLPVSIEGETGTGKEQIVKHIHSHIDSQQKVPLIVMNCSNLQKDLAATTLFGHKKGAFTGAIENSIGAIGKADGGILFLDEFQRLDISIQEQILRTMQDGSYQRIGDHAESFSQFRLMIATPKSLEQHALEGKILMDLRFRLYGIEIKIPPLRERLYQLPDFIDYFIANSDRTIILPPLQREALIRRCSEFYWQGNIRQLFGVLRMLVIQAAADGKAIHADDLPLYPTMLPPGPLQKETVQVRSYAPERRTEDDELLNLVRKFTEQPSDYETFMNKFENILLTQLYARHRSVKTLCDILSLSRSTYHAKKKRLGVAPQL